MNIEIVDGNKFWYINGELHREDGPACEYANGDKAWFINGNRHRENGPAIEWANGNIAWYINGQRHREHGPAIEYIVNSSDERLYTKMWYINGERHREDGPAVIWGSGYKQWYYKGQEIKVSSNEEFLRMIKMKAFW